MFVRPTWKPRSDEEVFRLINDYPWALLVNNGSDGPYATNLPLLLDRSRGNGVLIGHIALGNEHARALQKAREPTMAIFQGPHSYVTSSWYPDRDMPPTYYYTAVHCYGKAALHSEAVLHQWIETLTDRAESGVLDGWKTGEIESEAIIRRLKSIVGFEIPIDRMEAKFKLGQDEPKKDALAVADHLMKDPAQIALAKMIRSYNVTRRQE